jgi:pimeloyl-ACP methyl ester carboxylesterase
MRTFEMLLLLVTAGALLRPFLGRFRKITESASYIVIALVVMTAHLILEGARWQMVPVYTLITFFTIQWQVQRSRPQKKEAPPVWYGIVGLLVLLVILIPLIVFPLPKLIDPSGMHSVGTVSLYFRDDSREEIYSETAGMKRELNVQVWYPTEENEQSELAPYMTDLHLSAPAFARFLGLPSFVLNHIKLIDTHSFLDAPVAEDGAPYPVLIFSHGWGGTRTQSTYLMEELASHGYVVVAIDHTYGALVTVFPDDRVVLQKSEILEGQDPEEYDLSDNPLLSVWSADVSFILDQLEMMNAEDNESIFKNRLDLKRVGILGHSTGGGNTVQVCSQDPRCKVGFVMDAWLMPVSAEALESVMSQPFMFLWSEDWGSDENKDRFNKLYTKWEEDAFNLEIAGTRHYDFSDLPLLSPLSPWIGLKGPIDGQRVLRIINAYAVAYFDAYFKGVDSLLLEGESMEYPEVKFEMR